MSEEMTMEELLKESEKNAVIVKRGAIIEGEILSINKDEALVNLGYMADGVLNRDSVEEEKYENLSVGDKIQVYVVKMDDGEGNVLLSSKKADNVTVWDDLQKIMDNEKTFDIKIKETVNGGVIGYYKGERVFIPASQISVSYVENLSDYLNTSLKVKLIEFDKDNKKIVASHKVIEKEQLSSQREKMLQTLAPDDKLKGKVVRLADYGAFVDIGGVDGLIHVSEMSWKRVKHPSEVLNEGDIVEVIVLNVDREKEKVSLRLDQVDENPWVNIESNYQVDDIVTGKVTRLATFGAFVELESGLEGLVHISEISEERVNKVRDVLNEGQEVEVVILSIDKEQGKMSLSIKQAAEEDLVDYEEFIEEEEVSSTLGDKFGEQLKNLFK